MILFFLLTINLCAQNLTKSKIDSFVKNIDSLKTSKKLSRYFYPEMSYCGGSLYGYYFENKLVLIEANNGGEFGNLTSHKMYIKDTTVCKILYREHWAEEDKYSKKYPKDEEINEKKLTYSDTLYTVFVMNNPIFIKSSRGKVVSKTPNKLLIEAWLTCGRKMQAELGGKKVKR